MRKSILLLLACIVALPLAAQDVLTIGTISATPGATVTVPVYLRDVAGTPLGADAVAGNRLQGIMLQVTATPAVTDMAFLRGGVLAGRTALYERATNGGWIGAFSETAQPLSLGAGTPGDRIGTLRITLPGNASGTVVLSFNRATTLLSNEAGTVTESAVNRHLTLVDGAINLTGGVPTTTALSSSLNPAPYGASVTFTATVSSATPAGGTVIFTENGQILGNATLHQGVASWTTSSLSAGLHGIRAEYEGDASHLPSQSPVLQQSVGAELTPPQNVQAIATGATQVTVSWSAVANANQYAVFRKPAGGAYASVGTTAATSFNDTTAQAGQTYFYVVRAQTTGGATSFDSAPDYATTVVFTDHPLSAGLPVRLAHLTELRTAVNAFRAAAGLSPYAFTDPSPALIRRVHVEELRTALQAARTALGMPAMTFTDTPPVSVRAVYYQELRTVLE
ncbi:MAG TPA: Ig-like domain repeat protein [Thermoanaerobaculia bacterium]|nr:Ig-like domain repeat protein [Thermoanaerobaculia bacterium]